MIDPNQSSFEREIKLELQIADIRRGLNDAVEVLEYLWPYVNEEESGPVSPQNERLEEVIVRLRSTITYWHDAQQALATETPK